jgi:hypothetical protein
MERIHTSDVISSEIRKGFGAAAVLLAAIPNSVIAAPKKPASERTEKTTSIGMLAGDPYFFGVVGEKELHRSVALQLHAGTSLEDFSGGGRLLLKHSGTWEPYVGIGAAFQTRFSEVHPLGVGSAGLRFRPDRIGMFLEVNEQLSEGYGEDELYWSHGAAGGFLVELGGSESHEPETRASRSVRSSEQPGQEKPTWGVTMGSPYTIAVAYEHPMHRHIGLETHAGTVLLFSSVGMRVIVAESQRNGFYGYGGGGLWFAPIVEVFTSSIGPDEGLSSDFFPYAWTGVGRRFQHNRVSFFGEAGVMVTNDHIANGDVIPTIAAGIRL